MSNNGDGKAPDDPSPMEDGSAPQLSTVLESLNSSQVTQDSSESDAASQSAQSSTRARRSGRISRAKRPFSFDSSAATTGERQTSATGSRCAAGRQAAESSGRVGGTDANQQQSSLPAAAARGGSCRSTATFTGATTATTTNSSTGKKRGRKTKLAKEAEERAAALARHSARRKQPKPTMSFPSVSTINTKEFVYHRGEYFQVGDVVSLVDREDGLRYYAQIRGLLRDQFCESSAVLSWLLPTTDAPDDGSFDPASFVTGPDEDLPRSLDYLQFQCHAPSDYFCLRSAPFPFRRTDTDDTLPTSDIKGTAAGFIWTREQGLDGGRIVSSLPSLSELVTRTAAASAAAAAETQKPVV